MDAVRERYARALEYFDSCTDSVSLTRKVEVQRRLDLLPGGPGIAQMARALLEQSQQALEVKETALLNTLDLVSDPAVLNVLAEWVKQYPAFAAYLHAWIEASKTPNASVTTGAANAITILVRAGVQFKRADLRGIRVPGADLRNTSLHTIWLRQADLQGAKMEGVQFGECPFIEVERGRCLHLFPRWTNLCGRTI